MRWSDATSWVGAVPGSADIVIIGPDERMVLDASATVKAILVNGGELIVEDSQDLGLAADWVLVLNGGLFQVGTEATPFEHDFELTLEGDDASNDVDVMALMESAAENIARVGEAPDGDTGDEGGPASSPLDGLTELPGGTSSRDILTGTDQAEYIHGFGERDTIRAGGGDDVVNAGTGSDYFINGEGGADIFAFDPGFNTDFIRDFKQGSDKLWGTSIY